MTGRILSSFLGVSKIPEFVIIKSVDQTKNSDTTIAIDD